MTLTLRARRLRMVGGVAAGLALLWNFSCNPAGSNSGVADVQLSDSKSGPGSTITIEHVWIEQNENLTVRFRGPGEMVIDVEAKAVAAGAVEVVVPPYVNDAGAVGAGSYAVSVLGLPGAVMLEVEEPMALEGVAPGTVLAAMLRATIEDYEATIANLGVIAGQWGAGDSGATIAELEGQLAELRGMLEELETSGRVTVDLGADGVAVLGAEQLHMADRVMASLASGSEASGGGAAKGRAAYRSVDECLPEPPSDETMEQCFEKVFESMRRFATEYGTTYARNFFTGLGVVVAVAGAVKGAPAVAAVGFFTVVLSRSATFMDAALRRQNTDAFLQNDGEGFNAGLELLSQFARGVVSLGNIALSAVEGAISSFINAADKFIKGMDFYNGQKCSQNGEQKTRERLQETAEFAFCTITRPAGCDNSCVLAFNGRCNDGGPGSSSAICDLGTDCLDCGPRGLTEETGGCCAGGSCSILSATGCAIVGGTFQGTGSSCTPDPCATSVPTGACCSQGTCTMRTSSECAAIGGATYAGDGADCAVTDCPAPIEYVVWYTGNVCCWGAPHLLLTTRESFERPELASSYPGGGIDPSVALVKVELRGGFASTEEARAWVCPQFVSSSYHFWCLRHYQAMGMNWQPSGGLGCGLSNLPEATTVPDTNGCQ